MPYSFYCFFLVAKLFRYFLWLVASILVRISPFITMLYYASPTITFLWQHPLPWTRDQDLCKGDLACAQAGLRWVSAKPILTLVPQNYCLVSFLSFSFLHVIGLARDYVTRKYCTAFLYIKKKKKVMKTM